MLDLKPVSMLLFLRNIFKERILFKCFMFDHSIRIIKFVVTVLTFVFWFLSGSSRNGNTFTFWTNSFKILSNLKKYEDKEAGSGTRQKQAQGERTIKPHLLFTPTHYISCFYAIKNIWYVLWIYSTFLVYYFYIRPII